MNFMAVLADVKVLPEHLLESRRKLVAGLARLLIEPVAGLPALARRPPHRATPDAAPPRSSRGEIRRRDKLGGLIHEYYRAAA